MCAKKSSDKNLFFSENFYSEMRLDNMLFSAIVRSPVSKGKILSIDSSNLPEGYCFFSAKDIPGKNKIKTFTTENPIFCSEFISYKGEPIGIITGKDEKIVKSLTNSIKIEIDTYSESPVTESILAQRELKTGDGFVTDETSTVIESLWTSDLKQKFYSETNGAFCYIKNDILHVYTSNLWVKHLRTNIANVTGFSENNISITRTNICDHDSNSIWRNSVVVCQACVACCKTKKPILLTFSRKEQNQFIDNFTPVTINHKTALNKNGKFTAMEINIKVNGGAYNPFAEELLNRLIIASTNVYECKNIHIIGNIYKSANPPASLNLSTVDAQAFFAIENQINKIASKTDFSPIDLRILNIPQNKKYQSAPFIFNTENTIETINAVCKKSDFKRKHVIYNNSKIENYEKISSSPFSPPVRGIGLACAFEGSFFLGTKFVNKNVSIDITLSKEKKLFIHTIPPSPSIMKIWKTLASKILSIKEEDIFIDSNFDISTEPNSLVIVGNNVAIMTQLLKKCCESLNKKIDNSELPISIKKVFSSSQRKNWNEKDFCGQPFYDTSFASAVIEIELDTCTFREKIKGIWIVVNAGKILNVKAAESAIKSSIQETLSLLVENETINCNDITVQFIQSKSESKQIGEIIYSIIPAAFTSALSQALSISVNSIPLKTNTIYDLRWKNENTNNS